jgi:hypothetical protein
LKVLVAGRWTGREKSTGFAAGVTGALLVKVSLLIEKRSIACQQGLDRGKPFFVEALFAESALGTMGGLVT